MIGAAPAAACADPFRLNVEHGAAAFVQTRHLSGVRAPLVSRGVATLSPERVQWRVTEPMRIDTVITPAGVTQAVEDGEPQRLGPQGDAFLSSAGLFDLLVGDFTALGAHYAVTRSAREGAWSVRLAPKAESLARFVASIEVSGCERVERVEVRQAGGDWMEIALGPVED